MVCTDTKKSLKNIKKLFNKCNNIVTISVCGGFNLKEHGTDTKQKISL